jgi:hypothetical protein
MALWALPYSGVHDPQIDATVPAIFSILFVLDALVYQAFFVVNHPISLFQLADCALFAQTSKNGVNQTNKNSRQKRHENKAIPNEASTLRTPQKNSD